MRSCARRWSPIAATWCTRAFGNYWELSMPSNLELGLYIFMLATFVGLEVIRKVSPLLHTPLMSLTNAISAISVVGAILIISAEGATTLSKVFGFIAITAAVTNIVSGFLITDRMLKMFKRRGGTK